MIILKNTFFGFSNRTSLILHAVYIAASTEKKSSRTGQSSERRRVRSSERDLQEGFVYINKALSLNHPSSAIIKSVFASAAYYGLSNCFEKDEIKGKVNTFVGIKRIILPRVERGHLRLDKYRPSEMKLSGQNDPFDFLFMLPLSNQTNIYLSPAWISPLNHKKSSKKILTIFAYVHRGLDHAGKTSIIKNFKGEDVTTVSPTFGFDIFTLNYLDYSLNIWDIGGQKSLRAYWRNYFEQTDGVIWVVDSSDEDRLVDCKQELDKILLKEKLMDTTLLVFSNKSDLPESKSTDEISAYLGLASITTRHYKIVSCSAITGMGILDGIKWLVDDISSRMFVLE